MFDVKVTLSGTTFSEGVPVEASLSANLSEENFGVDLGKLLFSAESMGYSFSTSDVYEKAMEVFNSSSVGRKFVTLYDESGEGVSLKVIARSHS